jgi:hypothetical protein
MFYKYNLSSPSCRFHVPTQRAKKYCSASIMLGKVAEITHDFEIAEA